MERRYTPEEQRRIAAVRRELAVMMGTEHTLLQPPVQGEVRVSQILPGQEVVLFERNPVFDREISRRETLNEGEQFAATLRGKNERRG